MKSMKLIAAIFILTFLTMSFVHVEDWYQYETKYYKILFPKKPTESSQVAKSAIGDLKLNLSIYAVPENETEDNLAYLVNETEYPDSVINSDKKDLLENFFRHSIDGAVNNVQGKLLSEKVIELNKFPGREIRADYQNGLAVITMRLYLVRNKLFLTETITDTKKDFNKSISKFMDSFELRN
jgi:hypothetical protein